MYIYIHILFVVKEFEPREQTIQATVFAFCAYELLTKSSDKPKGYGSGIRTA